MASGPATFCDGTSGARQQVTIALTADGLRILGAEGNLIAGWRYDELQQVTAPEACCG